MKKKIIIGFLFLFSILGAVTYPPLNTDGHNKVLTFEEKIQNSKVFKNSHKLDLQIDSLQKQLKEEKSK